MPQFSLLIPINSRLFPLKPSDFEFCTQTPLQKCLPLSSPWILYPGRFFFETAPKPNGNTTMYKRKNKKQPVKLYKRESKKKVDLYLYTVQVMNCFCLIGRDGANTAGGSKPRSSYLPSPCYYLLVRTVTDPAARIREA